MACYLVSFEPRIGINFAPLMDELEQMGGVEVQPSRWFVSQDATVSDMFAALVRLMPTSFDDSLLLLRMTEKPRVTNSDEHVQAWVEKNFK